MCARRFVDVKGCSDMIRMMVCISSLSLDVQYKHDKGIHGAAANKSSPNLVSVEATGTTQLGRDEVHDKVD